MALRNIREIGDEDMIIAMDMTDEIEITKVKYPCLLSVDKDIFQPRLPSYLKKKASKDREISVFTLADMEDTEEMHYGLNGSPTQVQRIFPPEVNDSQEFWEGSSEELTDRLYKKLSELKFI